MRFCLFVTLAVLIVLCQWHALITRAYFPAVTHLSSSHASDPSSLLPSPPIPPLDPLARGLCMYHVYLYDAPVCILFDDRGEAARVPWHMLPAFGIVRSRKMCTEVAEERSAIHTLRYTACTLYLY